MFKIPSLLLFMFLSNFFSVKTDSSTPLSISDSKFQISDSEPSYNLKSEILNRKSSSKKGKIQVALLLDTSNSMDGLIDQAKSQLWKMVNKLASAKKEGEYTDIEIALFEYGNDNLAMGEGYIRMISSLSHDVDGLSEQLFKLKTNGGSEYCGWVIGDAVSNLKWSNDDKDLKLIIIAGNEPFDQGPKDFREACKQAEKKGIIINTVHCGDWKLGVETHWKDGADCGKGKYLNIETDRKIIHIRTPYDDIMIQLNLRLNKTYLGYGVTGSKMMERQQKQDSNAASYGAANAASRTAYKAKAQYKNSDWDIVDAADDKKISVDKMKSEELPEEMQKMSSDERKKYIEKLSKEREVVKKEIQELEKKIQDFTAKERGKEGETLTLDKVMEEAVVAKAIAQGFKFE
jgi:hypothetical protein